MPRVQQQQQHSLAVELYIHSFAIVLRFCSSIVDTRCCLYYYVYEWVSEWVYIWCAINLCTQIGRFRMHPIMLCPIRSVVVGGVVMPRRSWNVASRYDITWVLGLKTLWKLLERIVCVCESPYWDSDQPNEWIIWLAAFYISSVIQIGHGMNRFEFELIWYDVANDFTKVVIFENCQISSSQPVEIVCDVFFLLPVQFVSCCFTWKNADFNNSMHAYGIAWFLLFVQLHLIENFQYEWWASVCRCINSHAFWNDLMDHLIHRQCSIWTLFLLSFSLSLLMFVISVFGYFNTKIKFKIIRSCQRHTTTTYPCYKFIRPSNQYFMWANGSGIQFTSSNNNIISIVWFLLVLPCRIGDCILCMLFFNSNILMESIQMQKIV